MTTVDNVLRVSLLLYMRLASSGRHYSSNVLCIALFKERFTASFTLFLLRFFPLTRQLFLTAVNEFTRFMTLY